ncbi:hypothetical protein BLIN101_01299 [Brevibacterium linens]|uniref:Uncharacterized protein n=1 Tax=Brevibacterium linens TaxID=1703 RepID=A0A2H1IKQ7_BRELN|nr:hypothetical protein BLIN101_01299 [Brevibacterium linens]
MTARLRAIARPPVPSIHAQSSRPRNAAYAVDRLTLTSSAALVTDIPPSTSCLRSRNRSASSTRGRPPVRPRRRAASRPAIVLSLANSRSSSATAPRTLSTIRPLAVFVSAAMSRIRSATSSAANSSTTVKTFRSDRPRRSSLVTTRMSPARSISRHLSHSGREASAPLTPWSAYTFSHPAARSASCWASRSCPDVLTRAYPMIANSVSRPSNPRSWGELFGRLSGRLTSCTYRCGVQKCTPSGKRSLSVVFESDASRLLNKLWDRGFSRLTVYAPSARLSVGSVFVEMSDCQFGLT